MGDRRAGTQQGGPAPAVGAAACMSARRTAWLRAGGPPGPGSASGSVHAPWQKLARKPRGAITQRCQPTSRKLTCNRRVRHVPPGPPPTPGSVWRRDRGGGHRRGSSVTSSSEASARRGQAVAAPPCSASARRSVRGTDALAATAAPRRSARSGSPGGTGTRSSSGPGCSASADSATLSSHPRVSSFAASSRNSRRARVGRSAGSTPDRSKATVHLGHGPEVLAGSRGLDNTPRRAGLGARRTLGLMGPCPTTNPYSPLSGMWRTMFPATPSSSTWHGRRGYPALASWGSRRRNRRHMTGGTGRSVGTPRGASCSPRAWSRAEAGSEGAGARAGGVEGSRSRSRKRRWPPEWWRTGCIFLPGGVQESAGSTVSGTSRLEATGPGGFEVLEGACPGPADLEGRTGRRPQGGWSRVDLEGGAAGSRGPWRRVASPASWGRGHASRGGARSPGVGADLQELGRVSGGGASLPGRKEESGRAELRTGTQKSLSFTRPFLSGFLGTEVGADQSGNHTLPSRC